MLRLAMNFSFTDEQKMIRDTAAAFFAEVSTNVSVRDVMATKEGFDKNVWQRICSDMFFQAIHIPEQYGGLGLGYVELVSVLEQMGSHLLCSPFQATISLAANALLLAGTEDQKAQYLPQIVDGSIATLAYTGKSAGTVGGWGSDAVEVNYQQQGENFVLNGECYYVAHGHNAEFIIVAARKVTTKNTGISLFIVQANALGITTSYTPTMDQTQKQASIIFDNVMVSSESVMLHQDGADKVLAQIVALAQIGLAADQLGGMQKVLDQTVEYCNERRQFNRPIGSFQAVKHKAADMMLKAEGSCSAVYYAACVADSFLGAPDNSDNAQQLLEAANIAKGYCSDAYFFNAGSAIQLHGGVGFTWEYDIHLFFKRAQSTSLMLGNNAYHQEQIAARLLD